MPAITEMQFVILPLILTQRQYDAVVEAFGRKPEPITDFLYKSALDELRDKLGSYVYGAAPQGSKYQCIKEAAEFLEEYEGEPGHHTDLPPWEPEGVDTLHLCECGFCTPEYECTPEMAEAVSEGGE